MTHNQYQVENLDQVKPILGLLKIAEEEAYYHSLMVKQLVQECMEIMEEWNELNWTEEECTNILIGAVLLDVGKAYLPFGLQHNSGILDKYERAIINMHPILGCEAVKGCTFDEIVINIIMMHHANADGTGYPIIDGILTEKNVPDYVWLVAYADRFAAMVSTQKYKAAKSYPVAWQELLAMSKDGTLPYQYARIFGELIKRHSIMPI